MERADLIGLRMEGETLVIEPIEVKALENLSAAVQVSDAEPPARHKRLTGTAVDQLVATIAMLRPIFGETNQDGIFTPARREILKYQLFRECFRQVHEINWQESWFESLTKAFAPGAPSIPVAVSALIVHIHPEESSFVEDTVSDPVEQIRLVRLGQRAIQVLVRRAPAAPTEVANTAVANVEDRPNVGIDVRGTPDAELVANPDATRHERVATGERVEADAERAVRPHERETVGLAQSPVVTAAEHQPERHPELEELARGFLRASTAYGVQVAQCDPARAVVGPTVLRFYVRLAVGQKLAELRSNLDDIGRQMSRSGLLVSQIPNSSDVALDIPRLIRRNVPLVDGLAALGEIGSTEEMPLALGITPEGTRLVPDLARLPHLLAAGTTGSGKTMLLYSLLMSLIIKHPDPATLRLFLSTTKLEDFVYFEGLPHLEGGGVVDDALRAVTLLRELVGRVFEERGAILTQSRCRDIGEYNRRNPSTPLAPWVVVVDELADLAGQLDGDRHAQAAFYLNLRRIAQLGRNRGVHLILCTQRPSADLLPTNIRALMNARVSLNLNDATASRMILEEPGAEKLQMGGDLLFKAQSTVVRAQGYHVETAELDALLSAYRS
jgi:DNA segregation ATPase FtsK/SpoIIIE-like protein